MALTHIESLREKLRRATKAELASEEFQKCVLSSLISIEESHVSVRARLHDLEQGAVQKALHAMSLEPIRDDRLELAQRDLTGESVLIFQDIFEKEAGESDPLSFPSAVELLARLGYKVYGDGKFPLAHYLREVNGPTEVVDFPNFLQAISVAMQKPIPMCYKEAFADTDVDKSGRLDTRELFNMLRSVSDNDYSRDDVQEFLNNTDVDLDGKMDYAEMLIAFYFNN